MRAEFRLVFIMALLTSATLFLILQSPDGTPESLLLEKHSREIVQINEDSKNYHLLGDAQGLNDSKKSMQEKLKEASLAHMGLEVSSVDLIDGHYPFEDSQAAAERFGLEPSSVCSFAQSIPLHMKKISQTENFGLFAKKYSQYPIELYIMDERSYRSNVHYGLSASSPEGHRASTYFHIDSCTGERTDGEPYFLHCPYDSNGHIFVSYNYEDIVASISSSYFCKIELDPWRQSLYEYSQSLREERRQFQTEWQPETPDMESHLEFVSELERQLDLEDIIWWIVQGRFDEQGTQDMIRQYELQYGSMPEDLLELIGKR